MDGWNTTFLLGRPIFSGYVSFREGIDDEEHCLGFLPGLPTSGTLKPTSFRETIPILQGIPILGVFYGWLGVPVLGVPGISLDTASVGRVG